DRSRVSPHQVERGIPSSLPAALGGGDHGYEECRWITVLRADVQPEWVPAVPREGPGETFREEVPSGRGERSDPADGRVVEGSVRRVRSEPLRWQDFRCEQHICSPPPERRHCARRAGNDSGLSLECNYTLT